MAPLSSLRSAEKAYKNNLVPLIRGMQITFIRRAVPDRALLRLCALIRSTRICLFANEYKQGCL